MLEKDLHLQQPVETLATSSNQTSRTTRGLNLSSKYTELLSKSRRQELVRETTDQEATIEQDAEVTLCL